jgi:hypothetical protein
MHSQCLNRRIPTLATMRAEVPTWEAGRSNRGAPINWKFTNEKARMKLARLQPHSYMLQDTRSRSFYSSSSA